MLFAGFVGQCPQAALGPHRVPIRNVQTSIMQFRTRTLFPKLNHFFESKSTTQSQWRHQTSAQAGAERKFESMSSAFFGHFCLSDRLKGVVILSCCHFSKSCVLQPAEADLQFHHSVILSLARFGSKQPWPSSQLDSLTQWWLEPVRFSAAKCSYRWPCMSPCAFPDKLFSVPALSCILFSKLRSVRV